MNELQLHKALIYTWSLSKPWPSLESVLCGYCHFYHSILEKPLDSKGQAEIYHCVTYALVSKSVCFLQSTYAICNYVIYPCVCLDFIFALSCVINSMNLGACLPDLPISSAPNPGPGT